MDLLVRVLTILVVSCVFVRALVFVIPGGDGSSTWLVCVGGEFVCWICWVMWVGYCVDLVVFLVLSLCLVVCLNCCGFALGFVVL